MLSRRLLRVKVMQFVYAFQKNGDVSLLQAEKDLFHSISKSYELYHLFLLLLVDIHLFASNKIETGRNKKVPTREDLNPNTRFIENRLLVQLSTNKSLNNYIKEKAISWANNPEIIKSLFDAIITSDIYGQHIESPFVSYDEDRKFIVKLSEKVISQHEQLYNLLEEHSIFWNDEAEFIMSMVIKTLKDFQAENGNLQSLQTEFKDEDDIKFVKTLIQKTILNQKDNIEVIRKFSQNWDLERVAFMDIVLMQIALTEMIEFSGIPLKVTLNEYIELAKHYSTPKSGLFINGILDKIAGYLMEEGRVIKNGKGLSMGERSN